MSRYEGEIAASGDAEFDFRELIAALGGASHGERMQAIACALSAGTGWREAMKQLGGAFATDAPTGLNDGQEG